MNVSIRNIKRSSSDEGCSALSVVCLLEHYGNSFETHAATLNATAWPEDELPDPAACCYRRTAANTR